MGMGGGDARVEIRKTMTGRVTWKIQICDGKLAG